MASRIAKKSSDKHQQIRDRVMAATIRLTKQGGRGVLVRGGYILTAAHCIEWSGTGGMALGDIIVEPLESRDGRKLTSQVYMAEPVADIAALGSPSSEIPPYDLWEGFDEFAESVKGLSLYDRALEVMKPLPVQVLTRKGTWVSGTVTRYGLPNEPPGPCLGLKAEAPIEYGDSGSPIVDQAGRLVGLVSWASEDGIGATPQPWLALPSWLVGRIMAATPRRATSKKGR